eukprot:TRINITY_DN10930_c0_g1_i1.p1 TRINITY_DN10930_c0_g1~~TRINITY_DN10930_c0_g1_i1.p1  ORF type:complete len:399 (-),score=31.44 TRINITY_DN10930_c0_g1_i1:71-1267(-)
MAEFELTNAQQPSKPLVVRPATPLAGRPGTPHLRLPSHQSAGRRPSLQSLPSRTTYLLAEAPPKQCWCLQKSSRCPGFCCCDCCCILPRVVWMIVTIFVVYFIPIPFFVNCGYFLVYPGDAWGTEHSVSEMACNNLTLDTEVARFTVPALHCSSSREQQGRGIPIVLLGSNTMNMYSAMRQMQPLLSQDVPWDAFSVSYPGFQYEPAAWYHEDEYQVNEIHGVGPGTDDSEKTLTFRTGPGSSLLAAKALLAYVRNFTSEPVVMFGWSLGSSLAASLAVAESQADAASFRCLIMGNPFTSLRDVVLEHTKGLLLPWLYLFDDWPTADWMSEVHVPTIVLSSLDDVVVPPSMHQEVYKNAAADKKAIVFEQAGHYDIAAFRDVLHYSMMQLCPGLNASV